MFFNACCCNSCVIFQDDFNRADDTNLGANWDAGLTVGTWEIASNELKCTTANGYVVTSATATQNHFSVRMKGSNDGDCLRISAYNSGASLVNYVIELKVGATAKIRVYNDIPLTGTQTLQAECSVTAASGAWHELKAYRGRVLLNGVPVINYVTLDNWDYLSLGTGSLTGTAYFDDVQILYPYNVTTHPTCQEEHDRQWIVDEILPASLTAVATGSGFPALDGTYALDYQGAGLYEYNDGIVLSQIVITGRTASPYFIWFARDATDNVTHDGTWDSTDSITQGCGNSMTLSGPSSGNVVISY